MTPLLPPPLQTDLSQRLATRKKKSALPRSRLPRNGRKKEGEKGAQLESSLFPKQRRACQPSSLVPSYVSWGWERGDLITCYKSRRRWFLLLVPETGSNFRDALSLSASLLLLHLVLEVVGEDDKGKEEEEAKGAFSAN